MWGDAKCGLWTCTSREFSEVKGCERWQRGFSSSGFESVFIVCDHVSLQGKAGQWMWPLCSFPAVWYVVAAVLCMQFLLFPDAVNIFPVSLQPFARLCSQALRAGGFPYRESIADAGCTCSKARGRAGPPRGPAGCAGSPAEPCARSTSAGFVHQLWPIRYGLGPWSQLSAIWCNVALETRNETLKHSPQSYYIQH